MVPEKPFVSLLGGRWGAIHQSENCLKKCSLAGFNTYLHLECGRAVQISSLSHLSYLYSRWRFARFTTGWAIVDIHRHWCRQATPFFLFIGCIFAVFTLLFGAM